jgi:transposase
MDTDRAHNIKNNSRKRSPRSKAQTCKGCNERDIMDFKNWSPLEGYAGQVSAIPDLPSAFPGMDRARDLPGNLIRAGKRPVRAWEDRYPRGVHRREFCTGKKRGLAVGKTKRGKGTKIMAIADASGFPVAACVESASPHEVKLVEKTIDSSFTPHAPDKLIGDKAYDSDPLDQKLMQERCIELIAPHKVNRKKPKTQDGRKLRPYRRRWKVERLFAWLQNFRRIVVRYEYHVQNFLSMVQLGCAIILLRFF